MKSITLFVLLVSLNLNCLSQDFEYVNSVWRLGIDQGSYLKTGKFWKSDELAVPDTLQIQLDSLATHLKANRELTVEVVCSPENDAPHTHHVIGAKRAQTICDYLIEKGVSSDQLVPLGYGHPPFGANLGTDVGVPYRNRGLNKGDWIILNVLRTVKN